MHIYLSLHCEIFHKKKTYSSFRENSTEVAMVSKYFSLLIEIIIYSMGKIIDFAVIFF